jgi:hypothetical protein
MRGQDTLGAVPLRGHDGNNLRSVLVPSFNFYKVKKFLKFKTYIESGHVPSFATLQHLKYPLPQQQVADCNYQDNSVLR